ncbi:MAG: glycoside hydrolase family 19 protein [Burkholderiaceae bacterium]|jgi:putative chitinase|nr:glycoside hydrolase family 19 protein [Burkholderiaceae bacterium]
MESAVFARAAGVGPALAARWCSAVSAAMAQYAINTPARQAMFIAQIVHESAGLTQLTESFNYSVDALKIFSRISAAQRAQLGRQPGEKSVPLERQQRIANIAYGGRYGNGDEASGDSWRYRGRGLKQITFRDNYCACASALGVDLLAQPDLLASNDALAAKSAAWYWWANGCNACADRGDFDATTKIINGPAMAAQPQRAALYAMAKSALALA